MENAGDGALTLPALIKTVDEGVLTLPALIGICDAGLMFMLAGKMSGMNKTDGGTSAISTNFPRFAVSSTIKTLGISLFQSEFKA